MQVWLQLESMRSSGLPRWELFLCWQPTAGVNSSRRCWCLIYATVEQVTSGDNRTYGNRSTATSYNSSRRTRDSKHHILRPCDSPYIKESLLSATKTGNAILTKTHNKRRVYSKENCPTHRPATKREIFCSLVLLLLTRWHRTTTRAHPGTLCRAIVRTKKNDFKNQNLQNFNETTNWMSGRTQQKTRIWTALYYTTLSSYLSFSSNS